MSLLVVKYPARFLNYIGWHSLTEITKMLNIMIVGLFGYHQNCVLIYIEYYRCQFWHNFQLIKIKNLPRKATKPLWNVWGAKLSCKNLKAKKSPHFTFITTIQFSAPNSFQTIYVLRRSGFVWKFILWEGFVYSIIPPPPTSPSPSYPNSSYVIKRKVKLILINLFLEEDKFCWR